MLHHMSEFSSSLRLDNVPLYAWSTFCLSIRLFMDRQFGLFLLFGYGERNLDVRISGSLFSVLSVIYLEVELLDHTYLCV